MNAVCPETINDLAMLSLKECTFWFQKIYELEELWTRRHPITPFFTLGAASYLDAQRSGKDYYREQFQKSNPYLKKHFSLLYKHLANILSKELSAPVFYDDEHYALPGFHIFQAHPGFARRFASCHRDLQFNHLTWEQYPAVDFTSQISFTLSLRLPMTSGGLITWEVPIENLLQEKVRFSKKTPQHFHPYQEGVLTTHSGFMVHQISPFESHSEEEQRVTLQGHGLKTEKGYLLYW